MQAAVRMLKQRGVALVLVLWVLALLTVIAGSYSFAMRTEAALAQMT